MYVADVREPGVYIVGPACVNAELVLSHGHLELAAVAALLRSVAAMLRSADLALRLRV